MRLFSSVFWGIFLLVSGLLLIIKYIFKLNMPFGRVIFGVFIICIGISLLFFKESSYSYKNANNIIFNNGNLVVSDSDGDYNVIFSNGTVDLTQLKNNESTKRIKINSVFSKATVLIDSKQSYKFDINTAFGDTSSPDNKHYSFGEYNYTANPDSSQTPIDVETSTVFGSMDIVNK